MGACAYVHNSHSNTVKTSTIDFSFHDNLLQFQKILLPPNVDPSPVENPNKKMTLPPTSSPTKRNSSIQNERTQCSTSSRGDVFISDQKTSKNIDSKADMLHHNEQQKEPNDKPTVQKVKYKQSTERSDMNCINIVIFGDKQSGKSAFVIKYVDNYFEKLYIPSIGVEKHVKNVNNGKKGIQFVFWVTPGDREYKIDYKSLLDVADFVFVFYDISVNGSFNKAKEYCDNELMGYHFNYADVTRNVIFIGNKVDIMPRKQSKDDVISYCEENQFKYFEVSVKNTVGIKEVMQFIAMTHAKLIECKE